MEFCTKMCGQLMLDEIKKNSNQNMVVSPLSFSAILHMIATGSSGNTLRQMLRFLECKNMDDLHSKFAYIMSIAENSHDGPVICCLNGAWVDERFPLKASFQDKVERIFKARAKNINVLKPDEVVEETNAWAESATKGLVKDVLKTEHITPTTRLILGNALYFKGFWESIFIRESTEDRDFYLLNREKVSVPFMSGCSKYSHGSFDGFELVKIPYRGGKFGEKIFSMYIFLPNENDGLQSLLKKAASDSGFFQRQFKLKDWKYDEFWIPKFKITYDTTQGRQTMINMGLNLPFDDQSAELTEITESLQLYVSMVIQKAFIEIDEEGTEAAAVTFECDDVGCSLDSTKTITRFVADHPFMFMIREDRFKSVLFTGVVLNPLLSKND